MLKFRLGCVWVIVSLFLFPTAALAVEMCSTGTDGTITISTPATQVNAYFPAPDPALGRTELAAGDTYIPLDNDQGHATQLAPNLNTNITAGDVLLIVQMQGAEIATHDNHEAAGRYGDGDGGLQQAGSQPERFIVGHYEYVTATASPDTLGGITIRGQGPGEGLLRSYINASDILDIHASSIPGNHRYQVVKVPQFRNLSISGELTGDPWNGRWGNVVALDVANHLNVSNGSIQADGRGFRGGQFFPDRSVAQDGNFGFKGEGIAGTPNAVYSHLQGALTVPVGYPGADDTGPYASGKEDGDKNTFWTRDS